MKKTTGALLAAGLTLLACPRARADADGKSFDASASYYQPRDSRFRAEGVNFGFNLQVEESLTMGYKVEVLTGQGQDSVGGALVSAHGSAVSQGITAYYRTLNADDGKVGLDAGLWAGEIVSGYTPAGANLFPAASPFIEPSARLSYASGGGAHILLGLGYRFIRGFTPVNAPFGAGSAPIIDLDGLDVSLGVGYAF